MNTTGLQIFKLNLQTRFLLREGRAAAEGAALRLQVSTCVEDLDGVVGGAAARQRARGDDARVAQRAEVDARARMVVRAQQLLVHLRKQCQARCGAKS